MGINTGYCNVGHFGSDDRMDDTIIGAEANLAARLQSIAEPGHIVVGYEPTHWSGTFWSRTRCRRSP
jgi:class 3 adenylate cyclase